MANLTLRTLTRSGDTTKGTPLTNAEVDTNFINLDADIESKAPKASPTFTGTPLAPTATAGTNNTQIATTAFVNTAIGDISASNITAGTLAVSRGGTGRAAFAEGYLLIGNGSDGIRVAQPSEIVTAIGNTPVNKVHINPDPDDAVNYSVLIDGSNGVSVSKVSVSADTGRLIAPSFQGSIAASNINSGTIGTARLGSGVASASTYLRGDQTWASISTGSGGGMNGVLKNTTVGASSFTVPSGITRIKVILIGGGGNSGTGRNPVASPYYSGAAGGAGGAGGAIVQLLTVTPGEIINYYVGNREETTSFGSNVHAYAGGRGQNVTNYVGNVGSSGSASGVGVEGVDYTIWVAPTGVNSAAIGGVNAAVSTTTIHQNLPLYNIFGRYYGYGALSNISTGNALGGTGAVLIEW